jgi:1-phosphatidylinositol-3-phosphate 5-kinase
MCHLIACPIFFSTVIKGIVCKKNVAHRRMTSRIEKTRLLLLGGALEYHRVTNQLSSIDTLLQQVHESLYFLVDNIKLSLILPSGFI